MNFSEIIKRPVVIGVSALVLGIILGLTFGWGIMPVKWVDAPVNLLRSDLQEEYLRMSIDSYRVNGDEDMAVQRFSEVGENAPALVAAIKANPGKIDPNFLIQYERMLTRKNLLSAEAGQQGEVNPDSANLPEDTKKPETPSGSSGSGNWLVPVAIILGGLLAVGGVGAAAFFLLRRGNLGIGPKASTAEPTPAQMAASYARATEKTDYTAQGEIAPIAHYVTTYVIGDDLFDDSFSIDSPTGEFLGECGVGISETIGVGDPKKVTAFEVWMFDKNDIQTVTKVLMSPHAFNDAGYRAKLESKGELIAIEPRKSVKLETQTLQMVATVSDSKQGQGALPDGSYYDRLTLELAIWSKKS